MMIARFAIPFFFLMGLCVVPLIMGLLCRWLLPRRYWRWAAAGCAFLAWGAMAYGYFIGTSKLTVRTIEYTSADLPEAFDGYRIVQFSDAHFKTLGMDMETVIDSINAQQPDMVVFTGDMVNIYPTEILPYLHTLDRIQSKDAVYSVLGNHDYPIYTNESEQEKNRLLEHMKGYQGRLRKWHLLLNEHRTIRRNGDSIIIAGMENWGKAKRMPRQGDVRKTLQGVTDSAFVIMLQHDPTAWREHILPESHAQLTLSGHTHGGQFSVCGWSPVAWGYHEWGGLYYEGERALHVSTGLGGLIPFRLGLPGEIVVITLRSKKNNRIN